MPIPTNTTTMVEIAEKLRKDAQDASFGHTYVDGTFQTIIEQATNTLEYMNNSEVEADTDLLLEAAFTIAYLHWQNAGGDGHSALLPIEVWLDSWRHEMRYQESIH